MRFESTNGNFHVSSFSEAILTGFCPDGGLLMPADLPKLHKSLLDSWKYLDYPSLLTNFLQYIIDKDDPIYEYLADMEFETFQSFDDNVAQLKRFKNFAILELFHGPTKAFKDYALFPLAYLIDKAIKIKAKSADKPALVKQNMIIGTTGDTGSSALEASRNYPETLNVFVLFPKERITTIQKLQMTTANTPNGSVISCPDTCDEIDKSIITLNSDREFCQRYNISCLNSVNCGRIICQIAIHLYAYLQMAANLDEVVNIVIPCGGFGNLISACLAHEIGLPIKIVLCNNENDIGHRLIQDRNVQKREESVHSWSCAMDVTLPYNIARLFWIFSNHDTNFTRDIMEHIEQGEKVEMPSTIMDRMRLVIIDSHAISDATTIETMAKCFTEEKYPICPHTATGVSYFYKSQGLVGSYVVLATANIEKFTKAAEEAGLTDIEDSFQQQLLNKREVFTVMEPTDDPVLFLKQLIASHN